MLAFAGVERTAYCARPHASPGGTPTTTHTPRIVFDGSAFQESRGGIPRLWEAVLSQWARREFGSHVTVVDRGRTAPRLDGLRYLDAPRLRVHDSRGERRFLEWVCRHEQADLFLSSWFTTPASTASALYVFDMTPEVLGRDLREPLFRDKRRAIERASAIACLSQTTRDDLERIHPATRKRGCEVVYPGVGPEFTPAAPAEVERVCAELGVAPGYFLFLGRRDDYKNARLLAEAWPRVDEHVRERGVLFLGGVPELEPWLARALGDSPARVASVSDETMPAVYSGSSALLYLSRAEGFGLPPVEAMACGCPVIASTAPAVLESTDGAALSVGPDDPAGLAQALERVAQVDIRADLRARGHDRLDGLTWDVTAQRLADLLQDAIRDATR